MALSATVERIYGETGINSLPVKATSVIYKGSAVGMTAGYARALVAADPFAGFALESITGGATDGAVRVHLQSTGLVTLSVTSVAVTDIGANVYASDDGTFVLGASGNTLIGTVHRFVSSGVAVVKINAI